MTKKPEPITAADFGGLAARLARRQGEPREGGKRTSLQRVFDAVELYGGKPEAAMESALRLVKIGNEDPREPTIGYILRMVVLCSLPHTEKTAGANEVFTRTNGRLKLSLEPRTNQGLPFGIYPRLIMAFLTQEVQRTKKRQVSLGRSLTAFMQELGITPIYGKKGSVKGMREQLERLFGARMWLEDADPRYSWAKQATFADDWILWWDPRAELHGRQDDLFESTVTLSEKLFAEMLAHPIPFDKRVVREISDSPLAVDLYWWLGMRVAHLQEGFAVSWEQLAEQIGADYGDTKDFTKKAKKQLKRIRLAWPELHYETPRGRLFLYPSMPHVPPVKAEN
jgi:hypothetical protein